MPDAITLIDGPRARGQAIVDKSVKAASGTPPRTCGAGCQPCHRSELLLLATTATVTLREHASALRRAGYEWAPQLDPQFSNVPRESTVPIARLLPPGYVYVYYADDQRWDVWHVMPNALTRKLMHQVSAEQYATMQARFVNAEPPALCSQGVANMPAHLINISRAKFVSKVWIAFDEHLWAPGTLHYMQTDPVVEITGNGVGACQRLWPLRGLELSPAEILNGKTPDTRCMKLDEQVLRKHVVDFLPTQGLANTPPRELVDAFAFSLQPLDERRFGRAADLAQAVRTIETDSGLAANDIGRYSGKALMISLPHAKGVGAQYNVLRLAEDSAKRVWAMGAEGIAQKSDPERVLKQRSLLHVQMIDQWADQQIRKEHRERFAQGEPMAKTAYLERVRVDKKAMPPGARWVANTVPDVSGQPRKLAPGQKQSGVAYDHQGREIALNDGLLRDSRMGRVMLPPEAIDARVEEVAPAQVQERVGKLKSRIRWSELLEFQNAFAEEAGRFDKRIAAIDRDYAAWLKAAPLQVALTYDYDRAISLVKLNIARGTAHQQAADVAARLVAVERVFGGGVVSPESAKELARMYQLAPDDPANWIDQALLAPFSAAEQIIKEADPRKDFAESLVGIKELSGTVHEALRAQLHRHQWENAMQSLLAARAQLTQLVAAAVEPQAAKALGLAQQTIAQARQAHVLHLRVQLIAETVMNPQKKWFAFTLKVPVGAGIDAIREGMHLGVLPVQLEQRNYTSWQERRFTQKQFAALSGQLDKEMHLPVLLDENQRDRLMARADKEARRQGQKRAPRIEVVVDSRIGGSGRVIEVPESVAQAVIHEQSGGFGKALFSHAGATVGALWLVQGLAIYKAIEAMSEDSEFKGHAYADGLMALMSSVCGVLEGFATLRTLSYEIKANGQRTALASTVRAGARWRLGAGIAGAGAAAFDAMANYLKMQNAGRRGDRDARDSYRTSFGLYAGSTFSLMISSGAIYFASIPSSTAAAMGAEQAAAFAARRAGLALLGGWATGVGVVLSVLGFAYALYAQSLEFNAVDIFLDRSYWGKGERTEGKFGGAAPAASSNTRDRFAALNRWMGQAMEAEIAAFRGLTVGISVNFAWESVGGRNVLRAKISAADWPADQGMEARIEFMLNETQSAGKPVVFAPEQCAPKRNADTGRYECTLAYVLRPSGGVLFAGAAGQQTSSWLDPFDASNMTMARLVYNI
ncbi:MAG TPA: T6SS effector BTH_I2691 family protein, partial [Burkholderiaceae bacterium]|nr:T6SS effector BTH_I2691 family protein [Burkholderiaceae bacterium]